MSKLRLSLTSLALALAALIGCDSNPTPHPGTADGHGGTKAEPGRTDQPNEGLIDQGSGGGYDGDQDPSAPEADAASFTDDDDASESPGDVDTADAPSDPDAATTDGEVSAAAPADNCGAGEAGRATTEEDGVVR
ncbi:MAG: hypothetical protein U1F43_14320 [Myxococcota bacterium]